MPTDEPSVEPSAAPASGAPPVSFLAVEMEGWESAGLRRRLEAGSEAGREGRPAGGRVDFTSNDYLSLARDPRLVEAASAALRDHGVGGRASRLLGGGSPLHAEAERRVADWLQAPAALLFPTGYQANLGLVSALAGPGDVVLSHRLNHASLIDGARLSRARVLVFEDLDELEHLFAGTLGARRRLVLVEGVFSMDGHVPPLRELGEACARHAAWLVVDEAHAAGVTGPEGRGAWAAVAADAPPGLSVARVVTGGKALGAGGAFVVGDGALREHLVNRARPFVYTTAPSPALAGALCAAVEVARGMDAERARIAALARSLAERLGLPRPDAAILPVVLGSTEAALAAAGTLHDKGFDVRAVRPPTVPAGTERLRVTLHAHNTESEVEELARWIDVSRPRGRAPAEAPPPLATPWFVAGTDTEVGKTVVSALLLMAARRLGPAAYWKPVQTGTDSDTEAVRELASAAPHELLRPAWSLALPASPHEAAAAEGRELDPRRIEAGLAGLRRTLSGARLVVELAGGLLVPYRLDATQADWLARLRPPTVLVARSGLGTLNHTLLSLEALRARHVEPRALFLVGPPHASNKATLERLSGVERVLELPRLDPLTSAALAAWLDAHPLEELLGRGA